jgi:hypothetical protein
MQNLLPIDFNERIIRGIYSPLNVHKKTGHLKSNFYTPRLGIDEGISVLRPDITSINECRVHFKNIENRETGRSYWGIGLIYANEVIETSFNNNHVEVIPKEDKYNDYILYHHAELYYYINGVHFNAKKINKGEEIPPSITFIADTLGEKTMMFTDPSINSEEWSGDEIVKQGRTVLTINDFSNPNAIVIKKSNIPLYLYIIITTLIVIILAFFFLHLNSH